MLIWNEKGILTATRNAVKVATREGAEKVAADARKMVPKKTGALAASIEVKESRFEDGGHLVEAYGDKGAGRYYASFVELGTVGRAATPFLRPALHNNKAKILKAYEGKLK